MSKLRLKLCSAGFRGENVSTAGFFNAIERATGVRQPRLAVPFSVARLVGAAEELLAVLSGRIPQTTRAVIDIFRKNWIYIHESLLFKRFVNLIFSNLNV